MNEMGEGRKDEQRDRRLWVTQHDDPWDEAINKIIFFKGTRGLKMI